MSKNTDVVAIEQCITGGVFSPGNIIPHKWYQVIQDDRGGADLVSITILSEIVALFRMNKQNNLFFSSDILEITGNKVQTSYDYFKDKFLISKETIRRALVRLEEKGILKRNISNIKVSCNKRLNKLILSLSLEFFKSCFRDVNTDIRAEKKQNFQNSSPSNCGDHISNKKIYNYRSINKSNYINKNIKTETQKHTNTEAPVLLKERELFDFYPLSEHDCSLLQKNSERNFTKNAINEILLSMSRRLKERKFKNKHTFISYMTKALKYEIRGVEATSGVNFQIKSARSPKELQYQKQEKFLEQIECSLQISPEWHFKKKIACVLKTETAYEILKNYKSTRRVGENIILKLNKYINLTNIEKEIILSQAKATHEFIKNGNIVTIDNLIVEMPNKKASIPKDKKEIYKLPNNVWGTARKALKQKYGYHIDNAWFSKIEEKIDNRLKEITLKAPSEFFKDWIEKNYIDYIHKTLNEQKYKLIGIETQK